TPSLGTNFFKAMFWLGFILPIALAYLVPAFAIALTLGNRKYRPLKLLAPVLVGLIVPPLIWWFGWKFFAISINGYVNSLLLALMFGFALVVFYILLALIKKPLVSWVGLIVLWLVIY